MKETARHPQDAGPLSSTVGGFTRSWTRTLSLSHCSGLQCTEEITGEGVLQCLNTAEYLPGQMGSKVKLSMPGSNGHSLAIHLGGLPLLE